MHPWGEVPDLPPERKAEVALLHGVVLNGFEPVSDKALRAALSEYDDEEVRAIMARLIESDIARHVPEGWVLRGHGPRKASTRHRLLSR